MKRSVIAVSAAVALAAPGAASCSTQAAQPGEPVASSSAEQSPAPKPAAHVGATLDLMRIGGQKIAVTLTEVIDPATVPNGWGEPGKNYVAAKVTIENAGTTTIVGNSNSDVSMVGSDKLDHAADFATVTECKDFVYGWFLLAAGASTSGCVVFALPQGVTPVKIRYSPSAGISHDVGEWLNP